MKKALYVFTAALLMAGSATASDVVSNDGHRHVAKTSHEVECSTPSAKASRQCAHDQSSGDSHHK